MKILWKYKKSFWNFVNDKPFLVQNPISHPKTPLFVMFTSLDAPYFENWGHTPMSICMLVTPEFIKHYKLNIKHMYLLYLTALQHMAEWQVAWISYKTCLNINFQQQN